MWYRMPVCCLLLSLAVFSVALFYGLVSHKTGIRSYQTAVSIFSATLKQTYMTVANAEFVTTEGKQFDRMIDLGSIGSMNRVVWVNALERVQQQIDAMELRYEISPAETLIDSGQQQALNTQVQKTEILLRMGFRHDLDLYVFFKKLDEELNAIYEIKALEVHRSANIASVATNKKQSPDINLTAVCQISWYVVKPNQHSAEPFS